MKTRWLTFGLSTVLTLGLGSGLACSAKIANVLDEPAFSFSADDSDVPLVPASKVDLLLVVDSSASMGDKAEVLAGSIGTLIRELAKVGDMHVGVITSSLGGMGGDVCPDDLPASHTRAHLLTSDAAKDGVLRYTGGDVESLVTDTSNLVRAVGQNGCGVEAQLESTYRFLVQPDPWTRVTVDPTTNRASFGTDVDVDLLRQRKAFLRPDSALIVVMLTDEEDSSLDPGSLHGQGWAFGARLFPGSRVHRNGDPTQGTTAPRASSACADPARGPLDPACTSCGFASSCVPSDSACAALKNDPNCQSLGAPVPAGYSTEGLAGYYGPTDDDLNVRFHRMRERFGVDPQYPIARYAAGLTLPRVPNRAAEHAPAPAPGELHHPDPYVGAPVCTNPIFAATLPSEPHEELCNLPRGPRSRELVLFAVLGGVPAPLATATPNWTAILGADPDAYDLTGIDPHMIQSTAPRAGLAAPSSPRGDLGSDPTHGREWHTQKDDLQYACTFELPTPRTCTSNDPSCDCGDPEKNPPLCSATLGVQTHAKAYPTIRPLRVVRALGERGIVGSLCARSYDTTMALIAQRAASRLAK